MRQIKKALRFQAPTIVLFAWRPSLWRRDRKLYRVWFGAVGGTRVPGQVKHCGSSDPGHENYRGLQRIFPTNVVFSYHRIWSFRHDPNFFLVSTPQVFVFIVSSTERRPTGLSNTGIPYPHPRRRPLCFYHFHSCPCRHL